MKDKLYVHSFKTRLGKVHTACTKDGLVIITLPGEPAKTFKEILTTRFPDYQKIPGGVENKKAEKQIYSFFDGRLKKFNLKLVITGTPFQRRIMKKTAAIPYGKTVTYGDLAKRAGYPNSARAVGAVMAANPFPPVVPCHRVVGRNGLQGYRGGLKMKRELLIMEGADI